MGAFKLFSLSWATNVLERLDFVMHLSWKIIMVFFSYIISVFKIFLFLFFF